MPTPSGAQVNTTSCSFTPTGGSLTAIKGVKDLAFDPQVETIHDGGDGDFFDTLAGSYKAAWKVTIQTNRPLALAALTLGAAGALTWITNDSRNATAAGGGGLTYTLANAIYGGTPVNAPHRQFATGTHTFTSFSSDGSTSPLTSVAL